MSASDKDRALFSAEIKRRFEELTAWAIANYPDHQHPLGDADFSICRQQIALLAEPRPPEKQNIRPDADASINEQNKSIPEPSDSGPQYVGVTPSPWP
jgi:hypothetical protein